MSTSIDVTLPSMGESVSEGTVARWVKSAGDAVEAGEPLVEVTTDKVDVEVPAPASGRLAEIVVSEGGTVDIGGVLGRIAEGEAGAASAAIAKPAPAVDPAAAPVQPSSNGQQHPHASPLARRAAEIAGIDLSTVVGTGPGGSIRRNDVESVTKGQPVTSAVVASTTRLRGPSAALVEYMEQSRDIPTATSVRSMAVAVLDARRRELNAAQSKKISFTHLIGYAMARAAAQLPAMTMHFERDSEGQPTVVQSGAHLGIAVDATRKDGSRMLTVPVIRDVDQRDFRSFYTEYERLIDAARRSALTAEELRGATFTLTNPGVVGTIASVPRLMPGQGVIVATGAIGYPAEWKMASETQRQQLGVSKVVTMTSTYDHRVIQGAQSGEFLAQIENLLGGGDNFYETVFASMGATTPQPIPVARPVIAPVGAGVPSEEMLVTVSGGMSLVKGHRARGYLGAQLDPLGTPPVGDPALEPETFGLTSEMMTKVPAHLFRVFVPGTTLADALQELRDTYCGTIAYEIEHISSRERRAWLREQIESGMHRAPLTDEEKRRLLWRLTRVEALEQYLRRTFVGKKTFSVEGLDIVVPMLETLIGHSVASGIREMILGMTHRGRLAVLGNVVNRPYDEILASFVTGEELLAIGAEPLDPTGDVRYHLGGTGTYTTESGDALVVKLLSNPSHLEAIDGVVEGWTRALQTHLDQPKLSLDLRAAIPVLIHGDAAFSGEGIVAEVLNLQALRGYNVGGTVHIIANNQIGFTTDPQDGRSTRFASDLAKGFDIPIIHVNADDAAACIHAVRLAYNYREKYARDVVIDLIGYRRFGHNEMDEPSYTQPVMYKKIKSHPTVRQIFADQLVAEGITTTDVVEKMSADAERELAEAYTALKAAKAHAGTHITTNGTNGHHANGFEDIATGVSTTLLTELNEQLLVVPEHFHLNTKLVRQWERRRPAMTEGGIDWGTAESLAFASLLVEGHPIRLVGQDSIRGTFSHRHIAFFDDRSGEPWIPMQHLDGGKALFEVYNSPLSEAGALSFEYGYSAAAPHALVLWEAQFGDFVNNAQMVIDQFISSGAAKWGQRSRLVLLLPHGYEGNGPEHSSSRFERLLQLAANGNMRVAQCSTSAQYFHLLRQQALMPVATPLVILTPKSLLRLRESGCTAEELQNGSFASVIDDPMSDAQRASVTTLLLCTGKIYHDMTMHKLRPDATDVAIARVELLDPLPVDDIAALFPKYPKMEKLIWVQEEPANMGAWLHLARKVGKKCPANVQWDYVGRPVRASPSEGSAGTYHVEQERIVTAALSLSRKLKQ